jgi:hypothetical protein
MVEQLTDLWLAGGHTECLGNQLVLVRSRSARKTEPGDTGGRCTSGACTTSRMT